MNDITVNGVTYSNTDMTGDVTINSKGILIDGKPLNVAAQYESKIITISITGDIGELTCQGSSTVDVNGVVGEIETVSGEVYVVGDINGNVETVSGDVRAGKILGKVKTVSGDVNG